MRQLVDGIHSSAHLKKQDARLTRFPWSGSTDLLKNSSNAPRPCLGLPSPLHISHQKVRPAATPRLLYLADARIFPNPSAPAW